MAAAKDAALISFLQKISEQRNIPLPLPLQVQPQQPPQPQVQVQKPPPQPQPLAQPPPPPQQQQQSQPQPQPMVVHHQQQQAALVVPPKTNGDHHQAELYPSSGGGGASSRWPKAEVEALINLRTSMDSKYQENGPKGPLWEEISTAMKKLGYNRSSKRCKEKWENINKYFKKVKESNKKRREDSKTCPYFDQLNALYREKNKPDATATTAAAYGGGQMKQNPEMGQIQGQLESEDHEESEDEEEEEEEEEEGSGYEIVANNAATGGGGGSAAETTTATTTATAE